MKAYIFSLVLCYYYVAAEAESKAEETQNYYRFVVCAVYINCNVNCRQL
jgi:hypothetical protein